MKLPGRSRGPISTEFGLTDSNGNFLSNSRRCRLRAPARPGRRWKPASTRISMATASSALHLRRHRHPRRPPPSATVIESFGSTSLTQLGNTFHLGSGSGPSLKSGGALLPPVQPAAGRRSASSRRRSGYEVAWKVAGSDQYGIWMTDSNGNFLSNPVGVVSGTARPGRRWKRASTRISMAMASSARLATAATTTAATERHGDRVLRIDQPDAGRKHVLSRR